MSDGGPLPHRACGACDVCCVVFKIEEQSIAKEAGVPCRHLTKNGCGIYETRPETCRKWLCGWRLIPGLPEEWRPDLSGILLYNVPCREPGYGPDAYMLCLTRGEAHLKDVSVLGFVQNMVERRVPLYLMLELGKPDANMIFMNEHMAGPVARRDTDRFLSSLSAMIRDLSRPG
jgi:hypothetical protein